MHDLITPDPVISQYPWSERLHFDVLLPLHCCTMNRRSHLNYQGGNAWHCNHKRSMYPRDIGINFLVGSLMLAQTIQRKVNWWETSSCIQAKKDFNETSYSIQCIGSPRIIRMMTWRGDYDVPGVFNHGPPAASGMRILLEKEFMADVLVLWTI